MTDTITVRDPDQFKAMPQEYQDTLIHQMLAHAEGELMGVQEYLHVATLVPEAREKMYCYEGARDEMSHYILSARILDQLGIDTRYMLEKDAQRTSYPQDWLNGVLSWPQRTITSYLAERGALDIVEEMAESSYLPWAAIMPEIIEDEARHVEHGRRTTAELCRTEDGRRQVQAELDILWPRVLDMFGRSESARSAIAVKWGIRRRTNVQARQHFIDRVTPLLRELGLEPSDNSARRKFV